MTAATSLPRWRVWLLAARPATLPAAAAPVIVGSALAFADGAFRVDILVVTLAAALAIQIGVNFANDLADAVHGADGPARLGPTRAVASGLLAPAEMRRGILVVFGVAVLLGLYLVAQAGWVVAVIGVLSILAALGYTAGPFPYGYHGLGEVFVFVFFGLVATVGTRYVYDRSIPAAAWMAGIAMGALATAILVANNLRDIDGDRAAGKRTLAVLIGARATRVLYVGLIVIAYAVVGAGIAGGVLPVATVGVLLAVPKASALIRRAWHDEGAALVALLVGTARFQLVFALLLTAGILLAAR